MESLSANEAKMQQLKTRVEQAKQDVFADRTVDGNSFFDNLLTDNQLSSPFLYLVKNNE